jgi:hypothetical protein
MKELINNAIETAFIATCIFIGFTLLVYGAIITINIGFILSNYLNNYSHVREVETCQVLK